jgi:hypothetical protein
MNNIVQKLIEELDANLFDDKFEPTLYHYSITIIEIGSFKFEQNKHNCPAGKKYLFEVKKHRYYILLKGEGVEHMETNDVFKEYNDPIDGGYYFTTDLSFGDDDFVCEVCAIDVPNLMKLKLKTLI